MTRPAVSVAMPVRNAMPYLDASIASVLGQTHTDLELVIRDDRSTDGSVEVLRAWAARDRRVRLHEGSRALGPVGSSNWVVEHARAPLVARMDADDIAHPERLRRQAEVLDSHPDVDLVGTLWTGIDAVGRVVRPRDRWRLTRASSYAPFTHGSTMVRRSVFDRVGGYRERCVFWEDLDLYLRVARSGRIAVLPESLYLYRHAVPGSPSPFRREQVEAALDLAHRCVERYGRGQSYDDLLVEAAAGTRVAPRAIVSCATRQLWAGETPSVVGRVWRGARSGPEERWPLLLTWAVWAQTSPRSLRRFLRLVVRARNAFAGRAIRDGQVYLWTPGAGSSRLDVDHT